jgi:MFS family permease
MSLAKKISWARGISAVGDGITNLAFPLAVIASRGDPKDLAIAETFYTTGIFAGALLAPLVIDRLAKAVSLITADICSLLATLGLIYGVQQNSIPLIFLAYFLLSVIVSFHKAALDAVTADIMVEERKPILAGFSHLELIVTAGAVLGGLLAAQWIAKLPLWMFLAVDAASFLTSSVWILWLLRKSPNLKKKPTRAQQVHPFADWLEGFRATFANKRLAPYLLGQSLLGVAYGIAGATTRAHLLGTLQIPATLFAYFAPAIRSLSLLGAFTANTYAQKARVSVMVRWGTFFMLLGRLGLGWVHSFSWFVGFMGVQQFGNALLAPASRTITMKSVDSELRGRVAAFRSLLIHTSTIVGHFLALWLFPWGTTTILRILPLLSLAVFLLYLFNSKWKENLD